uniref:Uncharacterized protein n=1 Tax=Parascaris equorum TaxID=6256 RepID=A0A914R6I5_PAREQ
MGRRTNGKIPQDFRAGKLLFIVFLEFISVSL